MRIRWVRPFLQAKAGEFVGHLEIVEVQTWEESKRLLCERFSARSGDFQFRQGLRDLRIHNADVDRYNTEFLRLPRHISPITPAELFFLTKQV